MNPIRKLQVSLLLLVGVLAFGTAGYMTIEGWGVADSLYMAIITLSTIGFSEVHQMDAAGRIFTIVLIVIGVGTVAYALKSAVQILLEGEIRGVLGRRKVNEKINRLKGHYVICGYGRMGKQIASEFAAADYPFVVIEKDPEVVAEMEEKGYMVIQGDATSDDTMVSAGTERAEGVIAVLNSDAENLYVVLSARDMKPGLKIITRAAEEGAEKKLKRAGADVVVSPYVIGAMKIAQSVFRPQVSSFLDSAVSSNGAIDFRLEAIEITEGSQYDGRDIGHSRMREELGVLMVAIHKEKGPMITSLSPETVLEAKDRVICVGKPAQLAALAKRAGTQKQ